MLGYSIISPPQTILWSTILQFDPHGNPGSLCTMLWKAGGAKSPHLYTLPKENRDQELELVSRVWEALAPNVTKQKIRQSHEGSFRVLLVGVARRNWPELRARGKHHREAIRSQATLGRGFLPGSRSCLCLREQMAQSKTSRTSWHWVRTSRQGQQEAVPGPGNAQSGFPLPRARSLPAGRAQLMDTCWERPAAALQEAHSTVQPRSLALHSRTMP